MDTKPAPLPPQNNNYNLMYNGFLAVCGNKYRQDKKNYYTKDDIARAREAQMRYDQEAINLQNVLGQK